jgi:hypothetical protein
VREQLTAYLAGRDDLWHGVDEVAGGRLVRVKGRKAVAAPPQPQSRHRPPQGLPAAPAQTAEGVAPAARPPVRRRPALRRFALNVLPPFVSKGFVRLRRALRHQA